MDVKNDQEHLEARYGLPKEVKFCKKCVVSNQRPASSVEFKHTLDRQHTTMQFHQDGVCDACHYAETKEKINWKDREAQLLKLLDKYRRTDGAYDCLVPGSGGKDSVYAAHVLKYKYGMHPLTVTWPPIKYTEVGWKNFRSWIDVGGFDNISFNYNGKVHALLTKLAIEHLLHPFQPFILGQKNLPPKVAINYKLPLVFYGENEAEYGNPLKDNSTSLRDKSFYTYQNVDDIYIAGVSARELMERYGLTRQDLQTYLPADSQELERSAIEVHYLGYYLKWLPQEAYYYSVEHSGFQANPFRSEGTYSKYNSLDDKIDGFNFYTAFIKFGIGRTTEEASQEIRNKHITREEGAALVKRFEGEFPKLYFKEIMQHIGMTEERFMELCDQFRSPHLWKKTGGEWKLRHTVNRDGTDD